MAGPLSREERERFLAEPHVCVLSVTNSDARPSLTMPVWYNYVPGGNITFFTSTFSKKAKKVDLIQQAGVVSVCLQQESAPVKYVTVERTVVGASKPPTAEQLLPIVPRYMPEEMAIWFVDEQINFPNSELVKFAVRPDRWLTFDFSEDN